MPSPRYRSLLRDLRSGTVIRWNAPRNTLDSVLWRAAALLWPDIAPTVERQLRNQGRS